MIMIEINKTNVDEAISNIVDYLEKFANSNLPIVSIDNDGIGAYEYWGITGIDHGNTSVLIENRGPYVFGVDLKNCSKEFISSISDDSFGDLETSTYHRCFELKVGKDLEVDTSFIVQISRIENEILILTGEWTE